SPRRAAADPARGGSGHHRPRPAAGRWPSRRCTSSASAAAQRAAGRSRLPGALPASGRPLRSPYPPEPQQHLRNSACWSGPPAERRLLVMVRNGNDGHDRRMSQFARGSATGQQFTRFLLGYAIVQGAVLAAIVLAMVFDVITIEQMVPLIIAVAVIGGLVMV